MSAKADLLTTAELYHLDEACVPIVAGFGAVPYLVGSAGLENDGSHYRDVDVRMVLSDEEFAKICPSVHRWQILCLSITTYLRERTGLPVDFQIQQQSKMTERFTGKRRNPLGLGRKFAGGGDGTPFPHEDR